MITSERAMSIRHTQSSSWQSWLVLLLFAACCAIRVETLAVYGSIGTTIMEANALSSKYALSQDALCCFHSLPHCSVSITIPQKNSVCSSQPHWTLLKRKSFLVMGKGDGKKRRKKKSPTMPPPQSVPRAQQRQPPPQRVSTDINIPVRLQIRYGKMHKQAAKQSGTSFRQKKMVRTKYRRTWDEEEIEEKKEERRRRGQDPDWDVILNQTASSPLLIVDGYNIIYKWPRLKKHMVKGDPQRARTLLVDDLENLRSLKGWRIEVVFDGTGRSTAGVLGSGPGGNRITRLDQQAKKSVSKHGVRTVFTGVGIEADSYIQERCVEAKNVTQGELTGSFIVATDDAMIRLAGQSAGAYCMSADRIVDELKSTKKAMDYRVEAAVAKANGHAIRPEKLRGTHFHSFGRNSVLIEDKRNRKKKESDIETDIDDIDLNIEVEEDENGIPWWAKVPDERKF